jgi:hypothetical protein
MDIRHVPRRQRGYILMYVLAVMMILGGLALSVAYRQRIGLQLVHNVADMAQEDWALQSALTYAKAQVDLSATMAGASNAKDPYAEMADRWQIGKDRQLQVGDVLVDVSLRPALLAPDFNLFSVDEVTRLFVALGASADDAARFAQLLIASRPANGFTNKEDLTHIPGIPQVLLGKPDAAGAGVADQSKLPVDLYHLVDVGSKVKQIDLNVTPLPIVAALANLTMEQLAPLVALRAAGPVDKTVAAQKIGPSIASLAGASNAVLVHLNVDGGHAWGEALLTSGKGGVGNDPMVIHYGEPMKTNAPSAAGGADQV